MKKKISTRRQHIRDNISAERFTVVKDFLNSSLPLALLILTGFIAATAAILSIDTSDGLFANIWKSWSEIFALTGVVILVCLGTALYIHHYHNRIVQKPSRALALAGLFLVLLSMTKIGFSRA